MEVALIRQTATRLACARSAPKGRKQHSGKHRGRQDAIVDFSASLALQLELEHDARQLVVVLVIELHVHFVVAL